MRLNIRSCYLLNYIARAAVRRKKVFMRQLYLCSQER